MMVTHDVLVVLFYRKMISDLLFTSERLRNEKKFLSNMIIKLVGENQQLLRENKHYREEIRG